ncbi:hypothetical protein FE844_002965 [Rhizobium indicum]|uniref:hypothetical protein n=1 Tax=Rhizobium indicum TaxID=2583231 RepID=UPI00110699B9|nr:hypothetical protein [Rhizobium indicum]QKK28598.1 hypothetical protein FE844_002965 [Rhizobium indicum]
MNAVPAWILVLQALLTPAIAVAVGVIAFMQWRTAHQKVVLDLFDRRLAIVNEVNATISYALSENGNLVSINAAMRLYDCEAKSLFLFGSAVVGVIEEIRQDILLYHRRKAELERGGGSAAEGRERHDSTGQAFFLIGKDQERFIEVVLPFMRMHSKAFPTPVEWFTERNKLRLSYADDKQR